MPWNPTKNANTELHSGNVQSKCALSLRQIIIKSGVCEGCSIQKSQPKMCRHLLTGLKIQGEPLYYWNWGAAKWQMFNTLHARLWVTFSSSFPLKFCDRSWFGFIKSWKHMLRFRESEFETRSNRFQLVCIVAWKGYDRPALNTMAYMWLWLWFPTWPDHTCDRFFTLL